MVRSLRTTSFSGCAILIKNSSTTGKGEDIMMLKPLSAGLLSLCLLFSLSACGNQAKTQQSSSASSASSQTSASSAQSEDQEALVEYTVEGLGTFLLPEGFTVESGEITEPLPSQYATFTKDDYYIQANRMGPDAYEAAGVPLPADLEEYSTRSGVKNSVPEGTQFAYDDQGNYFAQFTQEDGLICYYVLLKGTDAYGAIFLTAPEDAFDAQTAALWLSGSQLL